MSDLIHDRLFAGDCLKVDHDKRTDTLFLEAKQALFVEGFNNVTIALDVDGARQLAQALVSFLKAAA